MHSIPPGRKSATSPLFLALALALPLASHAAAAEPVVVTITPDTKSWTVPAGVTAINVTALGGGGGGGIAAMGGAGGQVTATNWPVTPGTVVQVIIGTAGAGLVETYPQEEEEPPFVTAFTAGQGGSATSLQHGTRWIIAGGGGGGGLNSSFDEELDLSGGDGCGGNGRGFSIDDIQGGGLGGANGQGGAAGGNFFPEGFLNQPGLTWTPGAAGASGTDASVIGVSGGGSSLVVSFNPNDQFSIRYTGSSGGTGWGGGGAGGLNAQYGSFAGAGGGGSTGGSCVPGTNGGAALSGEEGEPPTLLALSTSKRSLAHSKSAPSRTKATAEAGDGGPGAITITYALPISASLGGTISGLTAAGLVLESGGYPVQTVSPAANATSFAFADPVAGDYAVTVKTQPAGLQCTVASGTGTISADVNNVAVSCVATPPAGGAKATPVPSLGALGVLMLSGLLGWLGMRRRG